MDRKIFNRLLKKIKSNQAAFTKIYLFYFAKIAIHISRKFNNTTLGEDTAQDFFVKLLEIEIGNEIEKPTSWVYTVSENIAKNLLVKRKREYLVAPEDIPTTEYEQNFFGDYSEKLKMIDNVTREIIIMFVWEGYSLKEISEITKISYDAVRQKYSRGLKKLKNMK